MGDLASTSSGMIVSRARAWDLARNVIDERIAVTLPHGRRTEYTTSVRVRSLYELMALAQKAGLDPTAWYGGLDGSALHLGSFRLVLVSARAARV